MEKRESMNNKGFSLVELIIVMAILAILAGVLAPQLIKYIDSSRRSSDVQNGQAIATAVNLALANEAAYDDAVTAVGTTFSTYWLSECVSTGDNFEKKVGEAIGVALPTPKFKGASAYNDFAIYITKESTGLTFEIYPGVRGTDPVPASEGPNRLYPDVGANYLE